MKIFFTQLKPLNQFQKIFNYKKGNIIMLNYFTLKQVAQVT